MATEECGENLWRSCSHDHQRRVFAGILCRRRRGFQPRSDGQYAYSPYAISLIDWNDPIADPIRRGSSYCWGRALLPDHPRLDAGLACTNRPTRRCSGLVHRYVDKALFLPLNTCPVYCRFCTRSYAIGPDTENVDKVALAKTPKQWEDAFKYIAERPELEDIVISGGDTYQLPPRNIELIGNALLDIPHVRRMRFATKGGPGHYAHEDHHSYGVARRDHGHRRPRPHDGQRGRAPHALQRTRRGHYVDHRGRRMRGFVLRARDAHAQPVGADPACGVNDTRERMQLLVKRLGYLNVHAYYVYMHDMVKGVEDLRTTIHTATDTEKFVRGSTAGFNTPTFVCDAPGGGGKRDVHSYEYYDRDTRNRGLCRDHERQARESIRLLRSDRQALGRRASARWAVHARFKIK